MLNKLIYHIVTVSFFVTLLWTHYNYLLCIKLRQLCL